MLNRAITLGLGCAATTALVFAAPAAAWTPLYVSVGEASGSLGVTAYATGCEYAVSVTNVGIRTTVVFSDNGNIFAVDTPKDGRAFASWKPTAIGKHVIEVNQGRDSSGLTAPIDVSSHGINFGSACIPG